MFDLNQFIAKYVIQRPQSMFFQDIEANRDKLLHKIEGKSVLVIGGAIIMAIKRTTMVDP